MSVTIESLHAALLASASATDVLETLFGSPVRAQKLPVQRAGGEALRRAVGPDRTLYYRRSRLFCGGRAVSDADLWFDPAALRGGMLDALNRSERPFGHVIRPLQPKRALLSARFPGPDEVFALVQHAMLRTCDDVPIAEVVEHYYRDAFGVA